MRQDPKMQNVVNLLGWSEPNKEVSRFRYLRLAQEETYIMYVADNIYNDYPDFIEHPFHLIGEKLKRIVSLYQPNSELETVVLVEQKNEKQTAYYSIEVPEVDCASDLCARYFGKIKDIILDVKKVGNQRIFKVEGDPRLIVRLDVAESILRRIPLGIVFERVELEQKEGEDDE